MINFNMRSIFAALMVILLMSGCSSRIGDFTTVSTKNVNMDTEYQRVGKAEGSDGAFFFLNPDMKLAVDEALESVGSNVRYLTDARIFIVNYPFYSQIKVEGDAWEPVNSASADGETYRLQNTEQGQFMVSKDGSERVEVYSLDEVTVERSEGL